MITREQSRRIFEEVKANLIRLDGCDDHDFKVIDPLNLHSKCRCSRCGGEISRLDLRWYEQGRKHGEAARGRAEHPA